MNYLSRLGYENDLLQRNVTVLRDENDRSLINRIGKSTESIRINDKNQSNWKKRKVKPKVWDSSQKTCQKRKTTQ